MEATTTHPEAGVLAVLAAIALAVVIDPFTVAGALMVVMAGAAIAVAVYAWAYDLVTISW